MLREAFLAQAFVELADNLVDAFDVVDMLTVLSDRCVEGLDVDASGIMVAGVDGALRVVASSSEAMRVLELLELHTDEGPCPECYRTGEPVLNATLTSADARWPHFAPLAVDAGFRSVHALPMRLRGQTIGALNLFRSGEGDLTAADLVAAQALADVATIAILQHRAAAQAQTVNEQLTFALNSRVVIEQAKGMVAEQSGLDMGASFQRIRGHARYHNLLLVDVAQAIIAGDLTAAALDPPARSGEH